MSHDCLIWARQPGKGLDEDWELFVSRGVGFLSPFLDYIPLLLIQASDMTSCVIENGLGEREENVGGEGAEEESGGGMMHATATLGKPPAGFET